MEMDSITSRTELICADCGVHFRARRVVDGVEEICDGCYEKRFPARDPHGATLHRRRHSLAADQNAPESRTTNFSFRRVSICTRNWPIAP